ncbi:hypothetical protein BPNPMPFG_003343 [Mesorhizobium sp. AR07]|uniref:hypothetical protein n=1 Tax=Mesorhizobium sp. AR07 TaxID=2865838 RepID=UPI002160AE94|nr:hypothetical protein [Mesorhizobium sp. AR07]UVK47556.1 hypothetical protein BPNPMPFG_003343 [Mesorhizobium sp. AR07]
MSLLQTARQEAANISFARKGVLDDLPIQPSVLCLPSGGGLPDAISLLAQNDRSHATPIAIDPGETRATGTIRRLIDKHGAEHARLVMCILAEGKGNWPP